MVSQEKWGKKMPENEAGIRHNHVIFTIMPNRYKFGLSYATRLGGFYLTGTFLRRSFQLLGGRSRRSFDRLQYGYVL